MRVQFVGAVLRVAINDEFEPGQQAPAADVADDGVAFGDVRQAALAVETKSRAVSLPKLKRRQARPRLTCR